MAAAAIGYAARRIAGRVLQPMQAVKQVQQSLLIHSGKPVYSPRVSPFSNSVPGRSRINAKVLGTGKRDLTPRQVKMVEYTRNAVSCGLTYFVFVMLFGSPGERKKIGPSPES